MRSCDKNIMDELRGKYKDKFADANVVFNQIHRGDRIFVRGVGTELLSYLTYLGKRSGLLGFTADVLEENQRMLHLFKKMGFAIRRSSSGNIVELDMDFL